MPEGNRSGNAQEAAEWVSYANDPDHRERKSNGAPQPLNIKLWQIGNETSYGNATFTKDEAIAHTIEFSRAMKVRDRSIELIGWGDRGRGGDLWADDLLKRAAEYIDYVAIHMGMGPRARIRCCVGCGTSASRSARGRNCWSCRTTSTSALANWSRRLRLAERMQTSRSRRGTSA